MRAHPEVVAALAARGITDLSLVLIEVWTYGQALMPEQWRDRRLGWCDIWYRETPDGQPLRAPGVRPEAGGRHEHPGAARDRGRPRLRAPGGGRASTCPGPGPASCAPTSGRWRSPSPRASPSPSRAPSSLAELVDAARLQLPRGPGDLPGGLRRPRHRRATSPTGCRSRRWWCPTATPRFDHYRRTAFDIGEWGLGFMTTSLELGCDCLGEIRLRRRRAPRHPGRAVHDHERDLPARGGQRRAVEARRRTSIGAEVRRMRRMVVSCHATVANYEYLIYWRFYQDGNIECEVRATGLMVDHAVRRRRTSRPPTARWSTTGRTRRSTSTSWWPGWTSTSTVTRTP